MRRRATWRRRGASGHGLVAKWRKALRVRRTIGSHQRLSEAVKAADSARAQKIAKAKLGKPRPRHVIEAMRKARLGRKVSAETRAKMSAAHRRRGTRPPKAGRAWTAKEDRLVRTLPPRQVAKLVDRTMQAVYTRRNKLGINRHWTEAHDAVVRSTSPAEAARLTGRTLSAVWTRRARLRIDDGNQKRRRR